MQLYSRFWSLLGIALTLGVLIAWFDSRPGWDNTGITVIIVLGVSALFGFALPECAWLWALAVGVWIPLWGIILTQNYGALLALLIAFVGAYAGALTHKVWRMVNQQQHP